MQSLPIAFKAAFALPHCTPSVLTGLCVFMRVPHTCAACGSYTSADTAECVHDGGMETVFNEEVLHTRICNMYVCI